MFITLYRKTMTLFGARLATGSISLPSFDDWSLILLLVEHRGG